MFRAGFYSGLGSAFDIGTKGYGTMVGRTSIMAIIGGTFANLSGGKFANGAMSAAFTHLFNAEANLYKVLDRIQKGYSILDKIKSHFGLMSNTEIEAEMIKIYQDDINNMNRWLSVHNINDNGYLEIQQRVLNLKVEAEMAVRMYHVTGIVVYKNRKGEWVIPK